MQNKNLSSQRRETLILTFALAAVLAVSGCAKKETLKPVVNSNTNAQQVNQNTNTNANLNQNTNSNTSDGSGVVKNGEEIDTSDWQTYRNEEYGFEMKHPGGWELKNYSDNIYPVSILIYSNNKEKRPLLLINIPEQGRGAELYEKKGEYEIEFDGIKAKKTIYQKDKEISIYVSFRDKKNSLESGINFKYVEDEKIDYKNLFEYILKNIKFIE